MASSLFALLDDIATLTKLAASKTIPVLGDDLAVNAEKLSGGLKPERELPVVYSVFKWSLLNKAIVVIVALCLSAFFPAAIPYLLIAGALYLLLEGGLALYDVLFNRDEREQEALRVQNALLDDRVDMIVFEKQKIRSAVITDLVLSAEIIIIALGALSGQTLMNQALTLTAIGVGMTVGVYGLVALIVKLDDMGLSLQKDVQQTTAGRSKRALGSALLFIAVWVMKILPVLGVVAMFMVGTDILTHEIQWLHHLMGAADAVIVPALGAFVGASVMLVMKMFAGSLIGLMLAAGEKMIVKSH